MISISKISGLLNNVKRILSYQKEVERLKGEKFNVFSILKMERKENNTHSAFIGELLSSDGSHLKGLTFLRLFINSVGLANHIDVASTRVYLEYNIGIRNDEAKTGGRVDIIARDKFGNSICIENKINAPDQLTQIERYCNHNKAKNKVIYLTLDGTSPSFESKGGLVAGTDFLLLSYKEGITEWLEQCLKESGDTPILRETIKQYLILIRKMTSTTDDQHEKELIQLLIGNYEEAAYIASNFIKATQSIAEGVRQQVFKKLKECLPLELEIAIGVPIKSKYAQLWVWFKDYAKADLYFGIETFNGDGNEGGDLYIGIFNQYAKNNSYTEEMNEPKPKYWYHIQFIEFEGTRINFGNGNLIMQILHEQEYKEKLVDRIVTEAEIYIKKHQRQLLSHLRKSPDAKQP